METLETFFRIHRSCLSSIPALQAAYDFFESALEAALPTLSALLVRVEYGGCLSVRLMMEDAKALPDPAPLARTGQLNVDQTDGTLCLTLALAKEVS